MLNLKTHIMNLKKKYSNLMNWLNKKDPSSTDSKIANGLEQSKVNFIWVIRFQKGEKISIEESLLKVFLQRVEEKGIVIENWAQQREILRHESIGGFISHCGWSSVMEALKFGVPIIAIPIINDEPAKARALEDFGFFTWHTLKKTRLK
ncbi:hypothetical protein M9H77_04464 [Catharanthus roseus]|uniref:Uncharacterized protein n=1 Tax=Catharanthus roseus TaxID=4058 RepID=A0ACC0CEA2_CATRO|nr:hypothetical protein M9H77_04464 [Catharanthus roseus]